MYYAKVSNAFNAASNRPIDENFPASTDGFAKQRPEWEIVGAFAENDIKISNIKAGDIPGVASSKVTVTTQSAHGLSVGTPINIKGVKPEDYNVSAIVAVLIVMMIRNLHMFYRFLDKTYQHRQQMFLVPL